MHGEGLTWYRSCMDVTAHGVVMCDVHVHVIDTVYGHDVWSLLT